MEKEKEYLLWFEQMERKDVAIVGGKSSSLGEMTAKTDVPVPYGYATTAYAYRYFIEATGLKEKMAALIGQITDVENTAQLRDISSFAGQQDTYLNVQGAKMIIQKVKECYASCFTDRAVYYREKQGFDHLDVALSAVIQMMVYSKAAGVMFTVNVADGDDKNVLIEGAYGLGEYVVQGTVTPDDYLVSKDKLEILEKTVNPQEVKLIRKPGGDVEEVPVPKAEGEGQKLTDEQIKELAGYAIKIEKHYGCYMDMEWGIDERDGKIWILQARPETVWSRRKAKETAKAEEKGAVTTDRKVIVKGAPASPGQVSGKAHVILDGFRQSACHSGSVYD